MVMQTRPLGRTGHQTSLAVLGTAAFWAVEQDVADRCVQAALDAGVTHVDVAPSYGGAEERLAPWVPELLRREVLIGCKTMERTAAGARRELEASLSRLGMDRFPLYQLHAVTDIAELDNAMPALEAIAAAADEGLVGAVGITGHGLDSPEVMREAMRRYPVATVMFPINPRLWAEPAYRASAEAALAEAAAADVGVLVIKAAAKQPRNESTDATTWYEPFTDEENIRAGVHFALSQQVAGFCTPGDVRLLEYALRAAEQFTPLEDAECARLIEASTEYASIF
jgi:aryl-alcohol dehydrogenase-like predicted oxidoreductase